MVGRVAVIRMADDRDIPALAALRRQWTEELYGECGDPDYERRFAAGFTAEAPRRWGYLANAFVLAGYRNRGVGRELMTAVLAHAHATGLVRLVLSPAERAVSFYTRLGFGPADRLMVRTFDA